MMHHRNKHDRAAAFYRANRGTSIGGEMPQRQQKKNHCGWCGKESVASLHRLAGEWICTNCKSLNDFMTTKSQ